MSWNDMYKHELFNGFKFNKIVSKINVILTNIKYSLHKYNIKVEQII